MDFSRIAAGDGTAFEQLFREHYAPLCAFARQYLKDGDRAEDLVQDLFVRMWQDRTKVVINTSEKAYLFTAVRNRCLNALASVRRVRPLNEELDDREEEMDVLEEERMQRLARVQAAIEALPTERGRIFKMSRYDGLKYQEIADQLGLSVKTVENQMGKALRTLREELNDVLPLGVLGYLMGWLNGGGWG